MNTRGFNDDILIDKLVDGELAPEERRQLLLELDAEPGGWRRCALAFVEAQTWRSELREVMDPSARVNDGGGVVLSAQACALAEAPRVRSVWRATTPWLAVAAGLLLAFGLGRQVGVGERSQLDDLQIADSTGPSANSADHGPGERLEGSTNDMVTLVVNDHRGVPQRVKVPLVEARQLGAEFAEVPTWTSPELLRRLDQHGLGLTARRRYAPLYFEQQDQRIPFVVPVDDAVVTPVSRSVY
jgi:hypothetical protein